MKKTFREHHLLKILGEFDFNAAPLDGHLNTYFREHRAIGSKDRKWIAETIYQIVRWQGLIDHFSASSNWIDRLHTLNRLNFKKCALDVAIPPHIRVSFPKAFFQILSDTYGEEKALELCLASNTKAPITLRANLLKTTRSTLYSQLKSQYQVSLTEHSVWGLEVQQRLNFHLVDAYKEGHFEIQDEGSQLVADLVDPVEGALVLDYCAGSGGKTLAFAHKLKGTGQIYLHDVRKRALENAKKRLKRAGIQNSQIILPNSPHLDSLRGKMDWVLVDTPCSGSGTLRRNPDLKWKFSSEMLTRLVEEQRSIVKNALSFLKKGGRLVYATCSILPQENEEQIDYFQQQFGLELTSRPFKSLPTEGGMDGFFASTLRMR